MEGLTDMNAIFVQLLNTGKRVDHKPVYRDYFMEERYYLSEETRWLVSDDDEEPERVELQPT
jgi:hypothetical protein